MVIAAGSYPAGRWFESDRRYQNGPMVKWSRHRPFTAVTRVRTSVGSPNNRLIQAVVLLGGLAQLVRALALQARGHRFKSSSLHQKTVEAGRFGRFFCGDEECVMSNAPEQQTAAHPLSTRFRFQATTLASVAVARSISTHRLCRVNLGRNARIPKIKTHKTLSPNRAEGLQIADFQMRARGSLLVHK